MQVGVQTHDNTVTFHNINNIAKNGWAGCSSASGTAGENMLR
jgi:hypothetical protein